MRYILKNRNVLLLFAASGLFFINEMLLMPTLSLYLSEVGGGFFTFLPLLLENVGNQMVGLF
jgi:hypothetical protein